MRAFLLGTPFFRILLAFVCGIFLFEYAESVALAWPLFLAAVLFFIAHFFTKQHITIYKLRWLFGCGVFLFFAAFGFQISAWHKQQNAFANLNKAGVFQAELLSDPVVKPRSFMLKVKTIAFAADSLHFKPTQGNAIVYVAKDSRVQTLRGGDVFLLSTNMLSVRVNGNPEEFNYAHYLARKGFGASVYVDSLHWRLLHRAEGFSLFRLAATCQRHLLQIYKQHEISGDEFAVLAALTLGYQDEIRDELYVSYSNSGALHILSVSGLHVGIVYLIFAFALSFLDKTAKTRLLKSLLIIFLLWAYAVITGLSPSVMRAALMFSMMAFAPVLGFKSNIYNTIFFSAWLLLCIDPNFIFDVSFLLSYTAVLSIVIFHPIFKRLFYFKNKILNWSWDLFCVSIAAQIGTFPLGMYYFHKFSNHFLLTNFIAIPVSTLIIYAAVLLFVLSAVPYLGAGLAWMLKWLLKAQNGSIVFIDSLPHATFHRWISEWEVVLLYLFVLAVVLFVMRKRYAFLLAALFSLFAVQAMHLWRHAESLQTDRLLVYADTKASAVNIISENKNILFADNVQRTKQLAESYWLKNQIEGPHIKTLSGVCFTTFAGKRVCVLGDEAFKFKKSTHKVSIDYLVLTNKICVSMRDITHLFEVKTLVVDNSFSDWKLQKLKQDCKKHGISFYSTKEKGALLLQIDKKVH